MKILVTAGATREPIDAVRFLSNVSTGATGTALAAALIALGHHVTLLHGTGSVPPPATVADTEIFSSAAELFERLDRRLGPGQFDAVIMTAAVADYRPSASADGKLPSTAPEFLLPLVRNAKLLPRIKSLSPHPLTVVGFKLTVGADAPARAAAVAALFAAGGVDLVATRGSDRYFVQCKQWRARQVGVAPVRELFGVVAAEGAAGGYVVTSGVFTGEARRFADGREIELIDGNELRNIVEASIGSPQIVPGTVADRRPPRPPADTDIGPAVGDVAAE
jgi:phosphopantothenoylcysteine decarboxylase/phosphopantothenate--cysteine ligase